MKSRRWLWVFALLPLTGLPLIAQEPGAEDSAAQNQDEAPVPPSGVSPSGQQAVPAAEQQPEQPEEQVSADNNLSFPVDI